MCGIAGIVAFTEKGKEKFRFMPDAIRTLKKRGPDADGVFIHENVCLGHTRLSIIDLSSLGAQPLQDVSGRYTISFNGEFYNYKEKRKLLEAKGYSFRSETDTEVLVNLYAEFRAGLFEHVNGFFAFAAHDKQTGDVLIARDRMGIKPLYYYADEDVLLFASELKTLMQLGIPKELDDLSVSMYFQLGYIPAPHSIFRNVKKLQPGHFLHIRQGKISLQPYYEIPYPEKQRYVADDY
jgi:asparagine synthase (glutamine-hydrolysing)